MIQLHPYIVGPLATNCYLLYDDDSRDAILIDPGDEGDFLSEQIIARQLRLQGIFLTHGHYDHLLGLLPLILNFPNVPVYLHRADHFLFAQAEASAEYWSKDIPHDPLPPAAVLHDPSTQESTKIGSLSISTLSTPGHTPGSCCYYMRETGWLFSGDTLGEAGVSENMHRYSRPLDLAASRAQLSHLPQETTVYPGHGESFSLKSRT
jgi:glyoxylase-like metal-dependent hydrolase (beta-lactamase superfamily II)